jgi:hypothetical protein
MPDVMSQAGGLYDIRIASQCVGQLTADLGDLQRVGQPIAMEVVRPWAYDLRLRGESAQSRRVHHASPIPCEWAPLDPFGRLIDPALRVRIVIAKREQYLVHLATTLARPASRS